MLSASSMAVHTLGFLVVIIVVYVSWNPTALFSWHPILMVVGIFVLILQGIVVYNSDSSLVAHSHPKKKFNFHWCLEAVGLLSISCGFMIALYVKKLNGKPHFASWHGLLGLVVLIWCFAQGICGVLHSFSLLRRFVRPAGSRILHALSGVFCFTFACLVCALGLRSDWFGNAVINAFSDTGIQHLLTYITNFFMILVCIILLKQVHEKYLLQYLFPRRPMETVKAPTNAPKPMKSQRETKLNRRTKKSPTRSLILSQN
uniref:ascorbate ferrireductase (transmembrane) n=2 Tax=Schistocephalus solidus TaxID=70667 RepID=A0A0V0J756_SCHSO